MPKGVSILLERRESAIDLLRAWVSDLPAKAEILSPEQLRAYEPRKFVFGARCSIQFSNSDERRLDLLCDEDFPWKPPRVALVDRPEFLHWPHIEQDGMLCLFPESTEFDSTSPKDVAKSALSEACELIEELSVGGADREFRKEFLTYWGRCAGARPRSAILLSPIRKTTKEVRVHRRRGLDYLGESDAVIQSWLENRSIDFERDEFSSRASVVWFDEPLVPSEFPNSGNDLKSLLKKKGKLAQLMQGLSDENSLSEILVLFGMPTEHGPCFAFVRALPNAQSRKGNRWNRPSSEEHLNHGFRHGRAPKELRISRLLSNSSIMKSTIERADHGWLYGRDRDDRSNALRNATVTILGCGSLGGNVAVILAQAGVGHLNLVDPEDLEWANITRHPLGADFVGDSKAKSLAKCLRQSHPHIQAAGHDLDWKRAFERDSSVLFDTNLVVSLMGDWAEEGRLNELHVSNGREIPIVYGWTEPHACAGHAVVVHKSSGCLQCGFSRMGQPMLRLTNWPASTEHQEPACGATFQPYGPVELNGIISLIAEAVLDAILTPNDARSHRIWAGRTRHLERANGSWSDEWRTLMAERHNTGCYSEERSWKARPTCSVCGTGQDA